MSQAKKYSFVVYTFNTKTKKLNSQVKFKTRPFNEDQFEMYLEDTLKKFKNNQFCYEVLTK